MCLHILTSVYLLQLYRGMTTRPVGFQRSISVSLEYNVGCKCIIFPLFFTLHVKIHFVALTFQFCEPETVKDSGQELSRDLQNNTYKKYTLRVNSKSVNLKKNSQLNKCGTKQ